jgi:hypothetical protein
MASESCSPAVASRLAKYGAVVGVNALGSTATRPCRTRLVKAPRIFDMAVAPEDEVEPAHERAQSFPPSARQDAQE